MTTPEVHPSEPIETVRVQTAPLDPEVDPLDDLRMRLNSVLAVGLFTTMDEYLDHCSQVDVTARWVLGDLKYGLGSPAQRTYRAITVGQIYTAAHIEGLAAEIKILRDATPFEWGNLPLYKLVELTDEALSKASKKREHEQAKRQNGVSENPERDYYLSISAPAKDSV